LDSLFAAVVAALAAFIATNIDDIVILTVFFASTSADARTNPNPRAIAGLQVRHVVIGQYLGFVAILAVSALGLLGALIVSEEWIGLLGLVPLAMGIRGLFQNPDNDDDKMELPRNTQSSPLGRVINPYTIGVAAVTFANGADNIGVYIPLFAASDVSRVGIIIAVFLILVTVWCYLAYKVSRFPMLAVIIRSSGHIIVPILMIGLGIYILLESNTLSLITQIFRG
jgi:cadmium resistance transport/sequestration family protein